jgi:hypothetical protein
LLVGLLVAGLAAAVVIAVSSGEGRRTTLVATGPPVTPTGATAAAGRGKTSPSSTTTAAPTRRPPPPTSAPTPRRGALTAWPSRTAGSTVVLESVPETAAGRRLAVAKAKAALKSGLKEVGVLDSSRYASLHPGYYVVFAGVYDSSAAAQAAVAKADANGYRAAYARQITP